MLGRTDRRWRMIALLLVFSVLGTASGLRLGYWQVVAAPELAARAARTMPRKTQDIPPRAEILDRDGKVLAQTAIIDQLVAHPDLIQPHQQEDVVGVLGEIMGLGSGEARKAYGDRIASRTRYSILEQRITQDQSLAVRLAIEEGRLRGISLHPRQVRVYPQAGGVANTSLASQLLGFVNADGGGNYGVEQTYDARLTGVEPGPSDLATVGSVDVAGSTTDADSAPIPRAGDPVHLTIDAGLQRQLEKELAAAQIANGSPRVSGMVMDAATGAVLAWASVPTYDGNDFRNEISERGLAALRDPIASDAYEPGSVMKALTAAAALDRKVVTPTTIIQDAEELEFPGGHIVRNADHKSMGRMPVKDVVALSRNIGITRVAQRLGPNSEKAGIRLYKMWERLGIGIPTGVDIAAEAGGLAADPKTQDWAAVDLSNRAFGQGVSVTLVQLARAFAPMANGGYLVTPHMVEGSEASLAEPERVLSGKVARQMQEILGHVTGSVYGYAKGSLIFGHAVGGKTGTAQFWQPEKGQFSENIFNYTFVGYVGSDEPEAIIAVRIHETKPKIHGQGLIELPVTSFELFRKIALRTIKQLDIPRAKDPDVGFPVPRSSADKRLTPKRYAKHMRQAATRKKIASGRDSAGDEGRRTARAAGTNARGATGRIATARDRKDRKNRDGGARQAERRSARTSR